MSRPESRPAGGERPRAGTDGRRSALDGRTVLVTGATGFLGSHLCDRLVAAGANVHATSRHARAPGADRLRWHRLSLEEIEAVRRLLRQVRPDVIYHLSGFASAVPTLAAVLPTFRSLLESAVHLLTAATELGCGRIVVPGSMTEPGPGETDLPPGTPYAAAKWIASAYARMFHDLYQTPVVIVRPAMTYGPGQPAGKLIPYVIRSLASGVAPQLTNGRLEADWTYIDDMADALLAAGSAPGVEGETIELGTGELVSVQEIVSEIVELAGAGVAPVFGALPDRRGERFRAADVGSAAERLGWRAAIPLREGLRRTVEWYATAGSPA